MKHTVCLLFSEYLALAGVLFVSYFGGMNSDYYPWMGKVYFYYKIGGRFILSLSWGGLLYNIIMTKAEDKIPIYYPSCFFRWILSWNLWVPIAVLSFSMYVYHITVIVIADKAFSFNGLIAISKSKTCPLPVSEMYKKNAYLVASAFSITFVISLLSYVFIEKPAIDARVAFV